MQNYSLSQKLKAIRKNCNKTQEQFAKKLGVTRITVQNYETEASTPSIDVLKRYLELGKISWNDLLGYESDTLESELISLIMSLSPDIQDKLLMFLKSIIQQ